LGFGIGRETNYDIHQTLLGALSRYARAAHHPTRSPQPTSGGREVYLQLKRGTNLRHGDRLQANDDNLDLIVEILAKPEQVMVVTARHSLDLLQAAYHLGNRHVPLEITDDRLYLLPDPVLQDMLCQRRLKVTMADRPFQPQAGAYEATPHHHH
jgi:urease accessory protein